MKALEKVKTLFNSFQSWNPILMGLLQNDTIFINRLSGSLRTYLSIYLLENNYSPILICPDYITAKHVKAELDLLGFLNISILYTTEIEDVYSVNTEELLTSLLKGNKLLITTLNSLSKKVISKNEFEKKHYVINKETHLDYSDLIELLESIGYTKKTFVEEKGDYAIRGAIIDIFSFSQSNPARIEFDGEKISSIRLFDIDSQRSFSLVDEYNIFSNQLMDSNADDQFIFDYMISPVLLIREKDWIKISEEDNINIKTIVEREFNNKVTYQISNRSLPPINKNIEVLEIESKKHLENGYTIIFVADAESHLTRLKELLLDYSEFFQESIDEGKIKFDVIPVLEGFILEDDKKVIIPEHQIFLRPFFIRPQQKRKIKSFAKDFLNNIKKGDYVVHEDYGIGRFAGLERLKIENIEHEVIKILFAENDVLYLNINFLDKIKKYSSQEGTIPKLSKLGSGEWKSIKKKIKEKIEEAVKDLIKLYAERKKSKGYAFSKDTIWQKELEASFYYEDTPDQLKVTEEIKRDMESDFPMDRLVCGDVGFGKTEVAIRAAFKAVMDGKQVAVLVPTTILAEQHYNTFKDRLSNFPINVAMLSRFVSKANQKEILQKLKSGEIDIIIGTHRLLSQDISFKDLGLLIIDEEHRFGVMAKEKIRKIKVNVDTLYLTATPIPRTLNLALSGLRDISLIQTPPPNRLPIITEILRFDIKRIREAILFELSRKGQVFFVHDRIKSIMRIKEYLERNIPEAKFCVAHGQMSPNRLEEVLHNFLARKFDVLISTKIIESGIDIPNANTIIINRADRFGLAELYQLRGRVGRTNKQAYAYLLVPSLKSLSRNAIQRIQALEEFSELGSGFSLSMRDLEIRGAGNLLGTQQSGFIRSVGYDMYVKLIEETVDELKANEYGGKLANWIDTQKLSVYTSLDVYFDYSIPQNYIDDQEIRLSYYTRIFSIKSLIELESIISEMRDQFGVFPESVANLFEIAKIRFLASKSYFTKVEIKKDLIALTFPKSDLKEYYDKYFNGIINYILANYSQNIQLKEVKDQLKIFLHVNKTGLFKKFEYLEKFLQEIVLQIEKINANISSAEISYN